jgi:hypothetical protein
VAATASSSVLTSRLPPNVPDPAPPVA